MTSYFFTCADDECECVYTFSELNRSDLTESNDDFKVEDADGGDWAGEAERESIPDERLFGSHDAALGPLNGA